MYVTAVYPVHPTICNIMADENESQFEITNATTSSVSFLPHYMLVLNHVLATMSIYALHINCSRQSESSRFPTSYI